MTSAPRPGNTAMRLTVRQALALAEKHRFAGQLHEAESLCRQLLKNHPQCAEAHHILGLIAYGSGNVPSAIEQVTRAIEGDPSVALYHTNIAELHRLSGRADLAAEAARTALRLQGNSTAAWNNLGVALFDLGDFHEALACYDKVLSLKPDFPEAISNRANALRGLGRLTEAEAEYRRCLELNQTFAPAWDNLGTTLKDLERPGDAGDAYARAVSLQPNNATFALNLATLALEHREPEAAMPIVARVLERDTNNGRALVLRARIAALRGDSEEAFKTYSRALELDPDVADVHNHMANLLKDLGRLDEAGKAYRKALELEPRNTAMWFNLADSKRFTPGDTDLSALHRLLSEKDLSGADRVRLNFALGKAYADIGEHREAFEYLRRGNAEKRASVAYDEAATLNGFRRIRNTFTPQLLDEYGGAGDPSRLPIFILGMPRSGTTLVEQILASHPAVHGAGELTYLSILANEVDKKFPEAREYPENIPALGRDGIGELGAKYLQYIDRLPKDTAASRVTDKMPHNFYFVGLIHLALPNATIIRTMRDPLDTCVSCFSKLFHGEQKFAYDLAELGHYYHEYEELMAHWRAVLPAGRMLEVQYEDLVGDLEGQARRIVAHCGLEWDPSCLAFHKSKRPVRTASATQVRRPIYNSAVGRWRDYEEFLEPLMRGLGPSLAQRRDQPPQPGLS